MAKQVTLGATDRTVLVFIPDPDSQDGSGKTGLAHGDMTVSGTRVETDNDVVVTDYTSSLNALTNLTDAHNDWGWKEVSSTLAPGLYRLDIADAIFASGAWYAVVYVQITSSAAAASPIEFELVGIDIQSAVLPANVTQLGGDTQSATDLKDFADAGYDPSTNKVQGVVLTDTVTTYTNNTPQTGDSFARLGAPAGASISADIAAIEAQTDDIGTAGAGLTAVPWNAAWDAEVQSECADAITAAGLSTLDAAGVRTAVGLASANLDTQLTAIDDYLDTEVAAILEDTSTTIPAQIAALNNLSAAQVNSEVVDALATDTYAEPGQGTPGATISLAAKIGYLYKFLRNKKTQTATTKSIYNDDASTVDHKCTVADDGTTYSETEMTTGP